VAARKAHERRAGEGGPQTKYALRHVAWSAVRASPAPVIGLLLCSASAVAAFPGENGRIAYGYESDYSLERNRTEDALITVQPNGLDARPLMRCLQEEGKAPEGDCSATYRSPAYSPDGARLAFDAGVSLALMNSDGSDLRFLARTTSDDGEPAWSPAGGRVVFAGASAPGRTNLWVRSIAGGEARRLTGGRQPAWSSRNLIAFTRGDDVYTIRPDGSRLRRVTRRGGSAPEWSPRGDRLAFVREGSIYVVRADGRRPRRLQLPDGAFANGGLAWSPDGKRIAFEDADCFDGGIFATRVAGRSRRVTLLAANWCREYGLNAATDPDWQPLR
jgi:WD40-like Beta Propeller Repeat